MQCEVRSMAEGRSENEVPEGRVGQVCREWLVREDGVLAYKLQHEEIEQHYDKNRFNNKVVRTDLQEAKTLQKSEESEAELLRQAYERMLLEQQEHDADIAQQIHQQFLREERQRELEDRRVAMELQGKEKERIERRKREKEHVREMREVERARASQIIDSGSDGKYSDDESSLISAGRGSIRSTDVDFTDFCMKPPTNMTDEEVKKFQEEQDAELARLLQEQESKRGGAQKKDRQIAIEAQDKELARVLQEQERLKVKRARERARQKAILQQQQEMEKIEEARMSSPDSDQGSSLSRRHVGSLGRQSGSRRPLSSQEEEEDEERLQNVAMFLDPTYLRNRHGNGSSVDGSNSPSPLKTPSHSSSSSPTVEYLESLQGDEEDDPVPPYMPIQGQRRTGSLEKSKKPKKSRDGCKSQ